MQYRMIVLLASICLLSIFSQGCKETSSSSNGSSSGLKESGYWGASVTLTTGGYGKFALYIDSGIENAMVCITDNLITYALFSSSGTITKDSDTLRTINYASGSIDQYKYEDSKLYILIGSVYYEVFRVTSVNDKAVINQMKPLCNFMANPKVLKNHSTHESSGNITDLIESTSHITLTDGK